MSPSMSKETLYPMLSHQVGIRGYRYPRVQTKMDSGSLITEQNQNFGSIHIYFKFYVDFGLFSQLIITKRIVDFFRQTSGRKLRYSVCTFLEKVDYRKTLQ